MHTHLYTDGPVQGEEGGAPRWGSAGAVSVHTFHVQSTILVLTRGDGGDGGDGGEGWRLW